MDHDASKVVMEDGPERTIVGTARAYTMESRGDIPRQWQAFFAANYEIPGARHEAMYGLSFAADGQGGFRYGVGVEVDAAPASMPDGCCVMHASAGKYAVLRMFGPMTELPGRMDWLFNDWLPGSGMTQREGAVFERYPEDARNGPEAMAYELWIPVEEAA